MQPTSSLQAERATVLHQLLDHHAADLLARKHELRGLSAESVDAVEESEATMIRETRGLGAAMATMASRSVRRIEDALHRLQAGTYGRCSDCNRVIALARLRAVPFADACRDCQARRDQATSAFLVLA